MPTLPQKPNIVRVLPEAGTHIARVIGFIYMGTITEDYMGSPLTNQKIRLTFELPEDTHVFKEGDDPKPLVVSQEYTLSMGKKSNLRPIIEGIIGVSLIDEEAYAFDTETLVSMPCLVNIKKMKTKAGADYVKVVGTSPLMKGQSCKKPLNDYKVLNYSDKWDEKYFEALPQFIKDKMKKSEEYLKMKGITETNSDEISF